MPNPEIPVDLSFMEGRDPKKKTFTMVDLYVQIKDNFEKIKANFPADDPDIARYAKALDNIITGLKNVSRIDNDTGKMTIDYSLLNPQEIEKWTEVENKLFKDIPGFKEEFNKYKALIKEKKPNPTKIEEQLKKLNSLSEGAVLQKLYLQNLPPLMQGFMALDNGQESLAGGLYLPIIKNDADRAFAQLYLQYLEGVCKNAQNLDVNLENAGGVVATALYFKSLKSIVSDKVKAWGEALMGRIKEYDLKQDLKQKQMQSAVPAKAPSQLEPEQVPAPASNPRLVVPNLVTQNSDRLQVAAQELADKKIKVEKDLQSLLSMPSEPTEPTEKRSWWGALTDVVSGVASGVTSYIPGFKKEKAPSQADREIFLIDLRDSIREAENGLHEVELIAQDFSKKCADFLDKASKGLVFDLDKKAFFDEKQTAEIDLELLYHMDIDDVLSVSEIQDIVSQKEEQIQKMFQKTIEQAKLFELPDYKPIAEFMNHFLSTRNKEEAASNSPYPVNAFYQKTESFFTPARYGKIQEKAVEPHLQFLQTVFDQVHQMPVQNKQDLDKQIILLKGALHFFKTHPDLQSNIKTTGLDRFQEMLKNIESTYPALFKSHSYHEHSETDFRHFIKDHPKAFESFTLVQSIIHPKPILSSFQHNAAISANVAVAPTTSPAPQLDEKDKMTHRRI